MSSTMLELVQQAAREIGTISVPTIVAANTAADAVQLLGLLNAVGYELTRKYEWQQLNIAYRFTTAYTTTTGTRTADSAVVTSIPSTTGLSTSYMVTGTGIPTDTYISSVDSATQVTLSQAATTASTAGAINFSKTIYAFPSDYDRSIDETNWDKTKKWKMLGPVTPQQWEWLKSGYISTGPRIHFRKMGGNLQIWPPLTTAEYLGFEYVSTYWALTTAGVTKGSFTVDTDTCIFPDRLMVLGLKLKYFEVKNFDTTALYRDYLEQLDIAKANDGGSPTLAFAPRMTPLLISPNQIPDSGFG